ncbi:unnamed protein product [Protopolystoma xenopodis]|uniref:Uncharacterized protein n=1 Tax=Protopolystoma xenopodis TaxID=117903 RepID=A0A3S5CU62_9PLAT|nr:unnamed protein product [Protopolystoma xenopodis]
MHTNRHRISQGGRKRSGHSSRVGQCVEERRSREKQTYETVKMAANLLHVVLYRRITIRPQRPDNLDQVGEKRIWANGQMGKWANGRMGNKADRANRKGRQAVRHWDRKKTQMHTDTGAERSEARGGTTEARIVQGRRQVPIWANKAEVHRSASSIYSCWTFRASLPT